jgi:activating signal cointegrator complex subunit 2
MASDNVALLDKRSNVYAGDDFDVLRNPQAVNNQSAMHQGKRGPRDASRLLDDKVPDAKESILRYSETYNDEYDDTYDDMVPVIAVESDTLDDAAEKRSRGQVDDPAAQNMSRLIATVTATPAVFNRDAVTRRSADRLKLRQATRMTDEQLEGWKIMFDRHVRPLLVHLCDLRVASETTYAGSIRIGSKHKSTACSAAIR